MPVDYKRYPPNWKSEIRPRILARANNRCEKCGVANHIEIVRSEDHPEDYIVYDPGRDYYLDAWDGEPIRLSEIPGEFCHLRHTKIVLTIAHYPDPTPSNCSDDNLLALCQRCHNTLDNPMRVQHAKATRRKKRIEAALEHDTNVGQTRMFD